MSTIDSVSTTADSSSVRSRKFHSSNKYVLHKFTSNYDYLMMTLACTITERCFHSFIMIDNDDNYTPNLIHFITLYIIFGLPITYMKVIIGQYSQLGVIMAKHMCPIGHGVGYTIIFVSLYCCFYYGNLCAEYILYLLVCLEDQLYWTKCPQNSEARCWDSFSKCKVDCINETVAISTYVYWNETFRNQLNLSPQRMTYNSRPIFKLTVTLCFTWGVCYFFISMGIEKYKKVIQINSIIATSLYLILTLVCILTDGALSGVKMFFQVNYMSLISATAWAEAGVITTENLALARASHMMYGTYMTSNMKAEILVIISVLINFIISFFGSLTAHAIVGIITRHTGVTRKNIKHIWNKRLETSLTVMPQGLGFLGVPQIWTMMFFLIFYLILLDVIIIQVGAIERSIYDAHNGIYPYRNYLKTLLCGIGCLYPVVFSSNVLLVLMLNWAKSHEIFDIISEKTLIDTLATLCVEMSSTNLKISDFPCSKTAYPALIRMFYVTIPVLELFIMFLISIFVFWIYRVDRLSDDIHFITSSQPAKYWKILWCLAPVLTGMLLFAQKSNLVMSSAFDTICNIQFCMIVSPIPILSGYEFFRYLKTQNLTGLFQPEERWGPPDPEERHLRQLFNPRQEIRSRRRDDTCNHNCLLGNKVLKKAVADEEKLRQRSSLGSFNSDTMVNFEISKTSSEFIT